MRIINNIYQDTARGNPKHGLADLFNVTINIFCDLLCAIMWTFKPGRQVQMVKRLLRKKLTSMDRGLKQLLTGIFLRKNLFPINVQVRVFKKRAFEYALSQLAVATTQPSVWKGM